MNKSTSDLVLIRPRATQKSLVT